MSTQQPVGRGGSTTYEQKKHMLIWLQNEDNFALLTGKLQRSMPGVVAGAKLKKIDAYQSLASYVNQCCGTNWDTKSCKCRFESFKRGYLSMRNTVLQQGNEKFCVGPEDLLLGIKTIADKINYLDPFYFQMDDLFGGRQNLTPAYQYEPGTAILMDGVPRKDSSDGSEIDEENVHAIDDIFNDEIEIEIEEVQLTDDVMQSEIDQQERLAAVTGLIAPPPKSNGKRKKKCAVAAVHSDLQLMSASQVSGLTTSAELSLQVAHDKSKNKKPCFAQAYSESKLKEFEILQNRLEWEKFIYVKEKEEKKEQREADIEKDKRAQKTQTVAACVAKGMSVGEIKELLAMMGFD